MKNGENKNGFIVEEKHFSDEDNNKETNNDYSGLNLFRAEIKKHHQLNKEEEIEWVKKLEFDNERKEVIHNDAYETLIKDNLGTVWSIVNKKLFNNKKHEFFEELISAGYEALCQNRVFVNFDSQKGVRFSTYVSAIIKNEVDNQYTALKIQRPELRGGRDIINTYIYVYVNLEEELKKPPTFEELNNELVKKQKKKISRARFDYLFRYTKKGVKNSLDEYVKIGNRHISRHEITADPRAQQDFTDLEQRIDFEKLLEAIRESNLTVLEKKLLIEHCLEDKTYRELEEKYGKSYETIRTTINKVKKKINKILASKNFTIEDFL